MSIFETLIKGLSDEPRPDENVVTDQALYDTKPQLIETQQIDVSADSNLERDAFNTLNIETMKDYIECDVWMPRRKQQEAIENMKGDPGPISSIALLHPFATTRVMMNPLVAPLSLHHVVYNLDLPAYGRSTAAERGKDPKTTAWTFDRTALT